MWRNFNFLPINHIEESSDDSYNSVADDDPNLLVSPRRPPQSPSASPRALLVPDPPTVPEVLEGAGRQLRALPDRVRREQQRAAAAAAAVPGPAMPDDNQPAIVNFEDENADDVAQAMQEACRNLARFAWDANDLKFTFQKMEIKMSAVGVKKQYTKFQILSTVIPKVVEDEVKGLICKQE